MYEFFESIQMFSACCNEHTEYVSVLVGQECAHVLRTLARFREKLK
jgi:hypothetical protein